MVVYLRAGRTYTYEIDDLIPTIKSYFEAKGILGEPIKVVSGANPAYTEDSLKYYTYRVEVKGVERSIEINELEVECLYEIGSERPKSKKYTIWR